MRLPLLATALAAASLLAAGLPAETYEQRLAAALEKVEAGVARGPFQASWESLERFRAPDWYQDAKFGIFIHWGAYSVPAFGNEWYPRNMYLEGNASFKHHVAAFGPQAAFGYKDFIPRFRAERFDAGQWAALFREAGARYVMPVAEHHDGFPMYDCSFTGWSAARMGPRRDVLGELAAAVRKEGLHFGASSHRAEHWWFFEGGKKFDSDVRDPRYAGLYGPAQPKRLPGADHDNQPDRAYLEDWLARTAEIVDRYQPEVLWFDWWIEEPAFAPYLKKFAAYYYNSAARSGRGAAINYKNRAFPERAAVWDIERGKSGTLRPLFWQTDTSVCKRSWGYIENHDYKDPGTIVRDLVDIVSKNGTLLLNIGPRPDGTIPEPQERILRQIGSWLRVNGEAIYGTRPWKVYGEGPTAVAAGSMKDNAAPEFTAADIRFTTRDGTLYAIALAWPADGRILVQSLATGAAGARPIRSVELLGSRAKLKWARTARGLAVELPAAKPGDYAFVLKMATSRE